MESKHDNNGGHLCSLVLIKTVCEASHFKVTQEKDGSLLCLISRTSNTDALGWRQTWATNPVFQ